MGMPIFWKTLGSMMRVVVRMALLWLMVQSWKGIIKVRIVHVALLKVGVSVKLRRMVLRMMRGSRLLISLLLMERRGMLRC